MEKMGRFGRIEVAKKRKLKVSLVSYHQFPTLFQIHYSIFRNRELVFRNVVYDSTCMAKTGNVYRQKRRPPELHLPKKDFHTPPLCGKALHNDTEALAASRIIVKSFSMYSYIVYYSA